MKIAIFIGSKNDKPFLDEGLKYLDNKNIEYELIIASVHKEPQKTNNKIQGIIKNQDIEVIIAGAATATGLPGVIAGYLIDKNIPLYGVRFTKNPGQNIIEDATFNISSMPKGVPLAYTGYNEKGFLHACKLAGKIIEK